jgi:excisionase family DNA binding protein
MSTGIPDFEALLTTDEVLAQLRLTPRRMYRLIRSGELPAVRIGRQWRFRPEDIDGWMKKTQQTSCGELDPSAGCAAATLGTDVARATLTWRRS